MEGGEIAVDFIVFTACREHLIIIHTALRITRYYRGQGGYYISSNSDPSVVNTQTHTHTHTHVCIHAAACTKGRRGQ